MKYTKLPTLRILLIFIYVNPLNNHFLFGQTITWKQVLPPDGKQIDAWCISKEGRAYIAVDSLFFISTDLGNSWSRLGVRADTIKVLSIGVSLEGYIYYVTGTSYRYRSKDSAKSWDKYTPKGFFGPFIGSYFKSVEIAKNNLLLLMQGDNLQNAWFASISNDTLYQWTPLYFNGDGGGRIILSYSSDSQRIYVGQDIVNLSGGPYDGGIWSYGSINYGFYQHPVSSLFVDFNGGACVVVDINKVHYTSAIVSKNWVQRPNPPSLSRFAIVSNQSGDIFLSTGQTLYVSRAASPDWQLCSTGLPADSIIDLKISESGYLYLQIKNNGLYRSETPTMSGGENKSFFPNRFFLSQNYPNPFNPTTQIDYSLSASSFTTLKIYDMLGREVQTLVEKELDAGDHSTEWNAARYPSGIYFYQLQSGKWSGTKKLVLLK